MKSLAQIVAGVAARRRSLAQIVARVQAQHRVPVPPPFVFASGVHQRGQLWGFAELGYGVGFSLAECQRACFQRNLAVLRRMMHTPTLSVRLLLDSGAVKEASSGVPISLAEWDRRMDQYIEVAAALGPAAWLIAPDKVGDQETTLQRFWRQERRLRRMLELGAVLVLVLQPGPLSFFQLDERLRAMVPGALQTASGLWPASQLVPAFPMRPGRPGIDVADVVAYLRRRRPPAVHLLGMGPRSPQLASTLRAIHRAVPGIAVSIDASLVRPMGRKASPWAQQRGPVMAQVQADWRQPVPQLDLTEAHLYLEAGELAQVAQQAGAPREVVDAIGADPDRFQDLLDALWDEDHPWFGVVVEDGLESALQRAYVRAVPKFGVGVPERDRRLVARIFQEHR